MFLDIDSTNGNRRPVCWLPHFISCSATKAQRGEVPLPIVSQAVSIANTCSMPGAKLYRPNIKAPLHTLFQSASCFMFILINPTMPSGPRLMQIRKLRPMLSPYIQADSQGMAQPGPSLGRFNSRTVFLSRVPPRKRPQVHSVQYGPPNPNFLHYLSPYY